MKLLVDQQLPVKLALHLRSKGHDVEHVIEVGLDEADDVVVWDYAINAGRVVVSKDEDFVYLANRPGDSGRLIWVRLGNCRNLFLISAFDCHHHDMVNAVATGHRIIELR